MPLPGRTVVRSVVSHPPPKPGAQAWDFPNSRKAWRYEVYVPSRWQPDADVTLLLLIHSGNSVPPLTGSTWGQLAERAGVVVVAVDGRFAEPGVLEELVWRLSQSFRLDPARLYLAGPGELIAKRPAFFAASLSLTPSLTPEIVWARLSATVRQNLPQTTRLNIEVKGLRNQQGRVSLLLFNRKDGFPGDDKKALAAQMVDIKGDGANVTFDKLPRGEYAVVLLHDENSNGKMDTSFGFPLEGFGASNDPRVTMRAPTFAQARFLLAGYEAEHTLAVRVRYLG